ncbi:MAG: hypothetical protein EHM55_07985 [Acidobacteria bacterium]|nr:MAG: hypothetical protein EHM55_07985 [Acidobacteriota bacterium]
MMVKVQEIGAEIVPELKSLQSKLTIAGAAGVVVCAIGLALNPAQFVRSFLPAYLWMLAITLGSLALAMVHQVSGGAWGVVIRRILGAASRTLPLLTFLFLPIALGLRSLYPWADAAHVADDPILQWKQPYLNVPFFLARAAVYFIVWNAMAFFLNKWSVEQDATGDPMIPRKMQLLSAGGLLAYGLTITFAAFDWLMSLEPHWFSTIYGVLIMGGQALSAMAFSIVVLAWLVRRAPFDELITATHFHDLGNLMMGFTMLWAYFAFSQYLIIWAANIPEETEWYLHRTGHGWQYMAIMLLLFHFAVPFLVLLHRAIKRNPAMVSKVAAVIVVMRFVDLYWLSAPAFAHGGEPHFHWLDVALPISLALVWLGYFVYQLRGRALLPLYDPEFREALKHVRTA